MLDSDFWIGLAEEFRKLDPHSCLYLDWKETPSTGACDFELKQQGDCRSVEVKFTVLATRAVLKLQPNEPLPTLTVWYANLKATGVNDKSLDWIHAPDDGPVLQWKTGHIRRVCELSADLCTDFARQALEAEHKSEIERKRPARSDENDPTKWVDAWPVPGLDVRHRTSIKSQLMKAHSVFLRRATDLPTETALLVAFNGIAEVLFDAEILTVKMLAEEILLLVLESAIAGGWWWPYWWTIQNKTRVEIFPHHFGHPDAWEFLIKERSTLFAADVAEWHGKLLEVEAQENKPPRVDPSHVEQTEPQSEEEGKLGRTVIYDSYFSVFPDAGKLNACWAAGQHYSELKRWLRGPTVLKDGSAPDLAFRKLFTSGKPPREYRKQPRPKGWS